MWKKKERWELDGIEFDIDTYPMLLPMLEIESNSWERVDEAIELLGLDKNKKKICSATQIYNENDIDPFDYIKLHFDEQVKREKKD